MDRQSDAFVKTRGAGQSSTRIQTEVLAGERGLETVAKRLYGEQWRAGLALLIQENKLKANQWGSPLIREGQALQAPELTGSDETLAKLDRLGGQVIANNSKGLAARAELQRMQAEQQRLQNERLAVAQDQHNRQEAGAMYMAYGGRVGSGALLATGTESPSSGGGFAGRNQMLTEAEQSLNQYYDDQRDGSFLGDLKARAGQLFGGTGYSMAEGANALVSLGTDEEFRAQVGAALAKVVDKPSIVVDAAKKEWKEFKELPWEEQVTAGGKMLLETVASAGVGKVVNTAARRGVDLVGTELKALSEAISPRLSGAAARADVPDLPPVAAVGDEAFQQVYKLAPAAKLEVDELASAIAKKYDADLATAPVKSAGRAWQKVVSGYDGDASRIKDLARNTIIASEADIPRIVDDLAAAGAKVKEIKAADDMMGYSGFNASIKTQAGIYAEIQVNTAAMIFAKESPEIAERLLGAARYGRIAEQAKVPGGLGHKLYEQHRVLEDKASDAARAIASQSREYYDAVRGRVANSAPVLGGRGPATAWKGFDEALAGGPVRDFTTDGVRVSQRGIDVVERHVSRFGADDANNVMIGRLRQIEGGDISPTPQDLNFYTHELREFVRYRKMGWETGVPSNPDQARQLWLKTHSASLADYNLPLRSEDLLYHPDALKVMGW